MNLRINVQLKTRFSDLVVLTCNVKDVKVEKQNAELEKFKDEITEKAKKKYYLNSVRNLPTFRAYRDFFLESRNRSHEESASCRGFDSQGSGRKGYPSYKHPC